ncbi:MAG: hypothetical protein ACI8W7_004750, partial [Gammaproteobacteria bacterium]
TSCVAHRHLRKQYSSAQTLAMLLMVTKTNVIYA